jgi:hypothetical protein
VIRHPDGSEERKLNQDETLAAKEKQKKIKESFKQWIWTDPDRTERFVRIYNDTYNNIRLRAFDGSHLDFPGMNPNIDLRQHQKDGVWRVMSGGNTLLAHVVGSGKTNVCAAAAMKMKQAGLRRKIMIITPNHMLEQFGREFMHLYPNAKLLIAGKEDFAKDKRKLLTAKIASRDWDAIIVTHSSFERIGMSPEYQADFLREQIADYEQLLIDAERTVKETSGRGRPNIIKNLEKQKESFEEKLTDILARDKKDDGLTFDELGIDHIFYDESQAGKNLSTPTKMDRVAGIQTGGSERAMDLYMKCRYLNQKHPGHGVTFASGTPISNTMVEMFTVQRYLDPDGLRERGIDHFDAWAASFGEVVDAMEISPDGKTLRPRSRFAKFVNLPELQQMFRSFADVKTADMLNLPKPTMAGGKPITISCPMSPEQKAIQDELVKRYEDIRAGKKKPWEDNALAVTTDGRKLALDARLVSPEARDFPGSKVNALVNNVVDIWNRTADTRGTQLIFSDMGVNPTGWGYSVYQEVTDKLVKAGIPKEQIASIGDADTDAKKQVLFDKVRNGQVRILLGSTQKMGTGTNVQKRLIALHHLDAPWKPAEVEQRDGRILRQGNDNPEVAIYRYVTEGSFDAYMWQALETKARFINQVMTGDLTVRQADDIGGQELSYAEVKAIASGNPAVLTLAETDAEIKRLHILKKNHADEQYMARKRVKELPERIETLEQRITGLDADIVTSSKDSRIVIGGRVRAPEDANKALEARLKGVNMKPWRRERVELGSYYGLKFALDLSPYDNPSVRVEGAVTRFENLYREDPGPRAIMNAVARLVDGYVVERRNTAKELEIARGQLKDYQARIGGSFQHEGYLDELQSLRDQLEQALSDKPGEANQEEIVAKIKALRESHTVEAAPERARRQTSMEEAVTTRILRGKETEPAKVVKPEQIEMPVQEKPAEIMRFRKPVVNKPKANYRQKVEGEKRQLSLF